MRNQLLRKCICLVAALTLIVSSGSAQRRGGRSSSGSHKSTYSTVAPRDSHGKIKRSESAKQEFKKETGYPKGRPGYVIDHIKPVSKGGVDAPSNMQWQTKADAKAKDKWERGQKSSGRRK